MYGSALTQAPAVPAHVTPGFFHVVLGAAAVTPAADRSAAGGEEMNTH
jgi:hypothetical protein